MATDVTKGPLINRWPSDINTATELDGHIAGLKFEPATNPYREGTLSHNEWQHGYEIARKANPLSNDQPIGKVAIALALFDQTKGGVAISHTINQSQWDAIKAVLGIKSRG